jgi:diguanylate cyclase (GGDEF)-like protein/PAS domain S-box-containing protein
MTRSKQSWLPPSEWDEQARLQTLRDSRILDTPREPAFDNLVRLATILCETPVGAINFIDAEREFIKAEIGINARERDLGPLEGRHACICLPTLYRTGLTIIPDMAADERLGAHEKVRGAPHYRFYAGIALRAENGMALGTLCVLDTVPRPQGLTPAQEEGLRTLAESVMGQVLARRETEIAREQARHLELLTEALPQMVWAADASGRVEYGNRRCYEFVDGVEAASDIGQWLEAIHPDDQEHAINNWMSAVSTGTTFETSYRLRHHSGEYRWALARATPVRDETGRIERWYGTSTDIHESRLAQEQLLVSEARYKALVEASGVIVWRADPAGSITESVGWDKVTGQPMEALLGYGWLNQLDPGDREAVTEIWGELIENPRCESAEFRVMTKDGSYRWFLAKAVPLLDEAGHLREWVGTTTDIHDAKLARDRIARSEARYKALTEASAMVVWRADSSGHMVKAMGWEAAIGLPAETATGDRWLEAVHPEYRDRMRAFMAGLAQAHIPCEAECRISRGAAGYRWVTMRAVPLFDAAGSVTEWMGAIVDVHDAREAEIALHEQQQVLAVTLENMAQGLIMVDTDGFVRLHNKRFLEMLELPAALLEGTPRFEDITRYQIETGDIKLTDGKWPAWTTLPHHVEKAPTFYERTRHDGTVLEVRTVHLPDGGAVRTFSDVTEHRKAERELLQMARQDALTGLPNRFALHEHLNARAESNGFGATFALLLIDIDNFKDLNDTLGHSAGDAILQAIADRLRAVCPNDAVAARLGGDEFAVVVSDDGQGRAVNQQAQRILDTLRIPFTLGEREFLCRASIGIARFPGDAKTIDEIVKRADIALYAAKRAGRDQAMAYTEDLGAVAAKRITVLRDAREALGRDAVVPFYQPKIALDTGEVAGFEALLRWRNEAGDLRSPGELADAFNDPELSVALGRRMLSRVIGDMRDWQERGIAFGTVAINIANAEVMNFDFADGVIDTLIAGGIEPSQLEVEVTENVFLGAGARSVADTLARFRDAGIQVSLDDFGTGYASLTHLDQFPLNWVKLDRSFVCRVGMSGKAEAILDGAIKLARSLGLGVVAEGIETEAQHAYLREASCELGQGYLFARPMIGTRVPHFVRTHNTERAAHCVLANAKAV